MSAIKVFKEAIVVLKALSAAAANARSEVQQLLVVLEGPAACCPPAPSAVVTPVAPVTDVVTNELEKSSPDCPDSQTVFSYNERAPPPAAG